MYCHFHYKEIVNNMISSVFSLCIFLLLLLKIVHYINNPLKIKVLWIARGLGGLGNMWDPGPWLCCIDLVTRHLSTQCPFEPEQVENLFPMQLMLRLLAQAVFS